MFALAREFVAAGKRVLVTTTTKIASDEATGPWPSFSAISATDIISQAGTAPVVIAYHHEQPSDQRLFGFEPTIIDEVKRQGTFDRILVEADGSARRPLKAPATHEPVVPATTDAVIAVAGLNGIDQPLTSEHLFRPEIWQSLTDDTAGQPITAAAIVQAYQHPDGLAKGCPSGAAKILYLNQADTPERLAAARHILQQLASNTERQPDRAAYGTLLPSPEIIGHI
jgi:probable selenium-dependent hydroxylase accessory protein YqeC